jgi:hypothetical protein
MSFTSGTSSGTVVICPHWPRFHPEKENTTMTKNLLAATMVLGISGTVLAFNRDVRGSAPPACRVQGVWERVATIQGGKRQELTAARQRKILTKKHFMWLTEATRRDTLPLTTAADSALFFGMAGGSGTYKVVGHHHTEHIDLFVDPRLEGKSLTASCRIEGNRWYHTYLASDIDGPVAGNSSTDSTTEIWRRVE